MLNTFLTVTLRIREGVDGGGNGIKYVQKKTFQSASVAIL